MSHLRTSIVLGLALLGILLGTSLAPAPALAAPDQAGSVVFQDPTGFPPACAAPCFIALKEFEVWLPDNPDNPFPLAGNNTYIYKITHQGGTGPFIPALTRFEVQVDDTQVTAAGVVPASPGTAPSATTIGTGVVTWDFLTTPIANGAMSQLLFIHSPLLPGTVSDNIASVSAQAALDASGSCVGPLLPPVPQCTLQVEKEGCVVQPPDPVGDACEGKLTSFSFQYTGLGCGASSHLQNSKSAACIGGATGQDPVDILVFGKKRHRWSWGWGWWGHKNRRKTLFTAAHGVSVGDTVVVDAAGAGKKVLGPKTYVKIKNASGWHDIIEIDKFKTNCRQPIGPGNQFGSLLLTSLTSTQGGTVTLPDDGPDDECVTNIEQTPAPHCVGKATSLTLRYVGGDCGGTMTSQAAGKFGCFDQMLPTANAVRIIVSDSASPSTNTLADVSPVNAGELVTVSTAPNLTNTTGFWIKDAVTGDLIQDGFFHTSCSQPLDLGDQFGGLQVFSIDSTQGGSNALGSDVDYTYTVTNPGPDAVDNVTIDDDKLGNIASGVSIAAGASAAFTATALIEAETTNVVTVNGDVAGNACVEASDSATITVEEPPEEPQVCTKKIAATLLKYTGPDLYGATVEFEAKSFPGDLVVYSNVDLIGGTTALSMAGENGFTIDGTAHGETDLGSQLTIRINGVAEVIHTSCSTPYATDAPAPLNNPKGDPSPNWFVVDFTQKQ